MVAESRFWGFWTAGKAVGTLGRDGCRRAYVKPAQVLSAHKSAGEVPAGAGWGKGSGSGLSGGSGAGAAAGAGLMFSGRSPLKGRWRWVAEAAGRCRYAALIFDIQLPCVSETRCVRF